MTIRELFIGLGYQVDENSEKKAEGAIQSFKDKASKLLGAIGIGFSLVNLNAISEEFRTTSDQIAQGTKLLGDQSEIQQKILESANRTRNSYGEAAKVISKLVQENSDLFGTIDEAVAFNDAATMLFKTAGKTNDQISGLMEAINKSFAKGKVDTETISQLLEQSPEYISLLNKRLGTTTDQLEQMVSEGRISLADLKGAVVDNADQIAGAFNGTSYKISDALLNIRNQWGLWVADMDETLGISNTIGTTMVKGFTMVMDVLRRVQTRIEWMSDKLGGSQKLFQLVGIIAASAFGVMALPKLLNFVSALQKMDKSLLASKLKIMALIAVVAIIALLVQDFISFMKGENSLIGELFDRAGIGAEEARRTILKAWGAVKEFLLTAWNTIQAAAKAIFSALSAWWEENGDGVLESFRQIWEGIKTICLTLWNALSNAARKIFAALQSFWNTWGSTIISVFTTIWNTLIALIQPFLNAIAGIISFLASVFTGDWEGAWNAIKDIAAAVWEIITTIISGALDIITAIWDTAVGIFTDIFQNIWNAVAEKVTGIKEAIVDGFQAAIDWILGLPSQAVQWGADIIDGIVNGIMGAIGKVRDAVKGVADKIKSFLGFSEPDEGPLSDFHTYMPDMMDLMAEGISNGKEKVKSALEVLTGDMSVMTKANVVSPETAAVATGGGQVSKSVVQNVEINNKFEGDRAGQQKSAEAMDKAAGDTTAELARALQYSR